MKYSNALGLIVVSLALASCGRVSAPKALATAPTPLEPQFQTASKFREVAPPQYMSQISPNPLNYSTPPTAGSTYNLSAPAIQPIYSQSPDASCSEPAPVQKQTLKSFVNDCKTMYNATYGQAAIYSAVVAGGASNTGAASCMMCQVTSIQHGTVTKRQFISSSQSTSCFESLVKPGATVGGVGAAFVAVLAIPQLNAYAGVAGAGIVGINTQTGQVAGCGVGIAGYADIPANIYGGVAWAPACFDANYRTAIGF